MPRAGDRRGIGSPRPRARAASRRFRARSVISGFPTVPFAFLGIRVRLLSESALRRGSGRRAWVGPARKLASTRGAGTMGFPPTGSTPRVRCGPFAGGASRAPPRGASARDVVPSWPVFVAGETRQLDSPGVWPVRREYPRRIPQRGTVPRLSISGLSDVPPPAFGRLCPCVVHSRSIHQSRELRNDERNVSAIPTERSGTGCDPAICRPRA